MGTDLEVRAERSRADRRRFVGLPYRLYRGHPVWVPPLRMVERANMDRRRHPFFEHAEVEHFLAWRGRRVVGRIAAIENRLHNEVHGDRVGFFGYFDVERDPQAAAALVQAARTWTEARGLAPLRGPVSYSTNETCGVLVEGFEDRPTLMMPYNRPDYDALLKGAGLVPAKDLLAFWLATDAAVPDRFRRIVERRLARSALTIRPLDLANLAEELPRLREVYNRCWELNWGFVPATDAEFRHLAKDMKPLVDPDLSAVAEHEGQAVGFSLILRDLNELLVGTNGRLLPRALPRILFGMRRVRRVRIVALGVVPEMRGRGVNEAFFLRAIDGARARRLAGGEAGWVLADNEAMIAPIVAAGGVATKRYRLYETPDRLP